ncbi:hypothetical protein Taro_050683 [Colocasia esculenta]|uniref:Uncharacterized protein n=1 Tax=Colocasia esculenta TaxID=4460 RepID=A0A843XE19_COLES|nr:hypothetical protein [Colocasia esculenta]
MSVCSREWREIVKWGVSAQGMLKEIKRGHVVSWRRVGVMPREKRPAPSLSVVEPSLKRIFGSPSSVHPFVSFLLLVTIVGFSRRSWVNGGHLVFKQIILSPKDGFFCQSFFFLLLLWGCLVLLQQEDPIENAPTSKHHMVLLTKRWSLRLSRGFRALFGHCGPETEQRRFVQAKGELLRSFLWCFGLLAARGRGFHARMKVGFSRATDSTVAFETRQTSPSRSWELGPESLKVPSLGLQLCGLQVWCWLVSNVLWLVVVERQLDLSFVTVRLRGGSCVVLSGDSLVELLPVGVCPGAGTVVVVVPWWYLVVVVLLPYMGRLPMKIVA